MKILLVDTLSEPGHTKFNQSIVDWLKNEDVSIYFSDSMTKNFSIEARSFPDKVLAKNSKWKYKFNQIVLMKNVLATLRSSKVDKVLFLSYEPLSMFIWSYLFYYFTNAKVFVFEHNTVPKIGCVKKIIYKMISKTVTHITLMDYISEYISDNFNKIAATVRHPMNNIFYSDAMSEKIAPVRVNNKTIFMPSATIDKKTTNKIFQVVAENKEYILYAKPHFDVKFKCENIILSSRFDNYNDMIASSDVVIIPQHFDYRVSGVLYEALQSNALIIVSDCIFGRFACEYFPDRVCIVSDWSKLFSIIESNIPLNGKTNKWNDLSDWNKQGRDELYEALNAND